MAIAFSGTAVLIWNEWNVNSIYGFVCGFISAVAFALYTVLARGLYQALPYRDVLMLTTAAGAVSLWLLALCTGGLIGAYGALARLQTAQWLELAYIVVFVSVIGYAMNGFGLRQLPSGIAASVTLYPQPIFAAVLQWFWIGAAPAPLTVLSVFIIFGATALMRQTARNASSKSGSPEAAV
ncbi:EamA family transporter [Paenibacillus sp. sgz302251]|uniref:EamA family transporter n=1 Tax=Paenibacillus sp. sgz302251 TaxID=3414493 RepID=UPI003C7C73CF